MTFSSLRGFLQEESQSEQIVQRSFEMIIEEVVDEDVSANSERIANDADSICDLSEAVVDGQGVLNNEGHELDGLQNAYDERGNDDHENDLELEIVG